MEMEMLWMVATWIGWGLLGVIILVIIMGIFEPNVYFFIANVFWFFCSVLRGIGHRIWEKWCGPIANINSRPIPIDGELVNPTKNGVQYQDCPINIIVRRKINLTLEVEVGFFEEKCSWYCFPSVNFYVGKKTGRIKRVVVNHQYIRNRGVWFRNACGTTDWPKYFTSVVLAHIEVLKFSQSLRSHHPSIISRVFKHYGENICGEI